MFIRSYAAVSDSLDVYLFGRNRVYDAYTFLVNRPPEVVIHSTADLREVIGLKDQFVKMHRLVLDDKPRTLVHLRFASEQNMVAVFVGIADAIASGLHIDHSDTFLFRSMNEIQPIALPQLMESHLPERYAELVLS